MEIISDLLKTILPATLVLYAMYLVVSSFLKKQLVETKVQIRGRQADTALPIRLQAYERICLFLERITPNNLLVRLSGSATTAVEFQQILLREIREEFNHNLSQQVYMSHEAWEQVRAAQQEVATLINQSAGELPPDAMPLDLSKKIFEKVIQEGRTPTSTALKFVKEEIQSEFMKS